MATQRTPAALDTIAYWAIVGPSYRWSEIAVNESLQRGLSSLVANRNLSLLHVAIYDAIVAARDSKHAYNRPRPSAFDSTFSTAVPNPTSPSYPSEEAAAAGAAASVLAYIFPDRAEFFAERAEESGRSLLIAGIAFPSDVSAGYELGRKVAAKVIERGKADGSDAKWTGSVPTGPGKVGDLRTMDLLWTTLMDQVHHRGQLSVYTRMAGGKVPSIYGPSADEPWM